MLNRGFKKLPGLALIAVVLLAAVPARADPVAGESCTQLGQTMMATGRKAIVACLLSSPDASATKCNGNCVWKVMNGAGGTGGGGCPSGFKTVGNAAHPVGCIQEAENASATHTAAMETCYQKFGGRLPVGAELYAAMRQYNLPVGAGAVPAGKHSLVNWVDSVYLLPGGTLGARGIDMGAAGLYAGEPYYPTGKNPPVEWAGYSANGNSYRFRCYLPAR